MASARPLLLPLALLVLTSGCETPDEDWPPGNETIRVGRARFGEVVEVSIAQQTEEWEFCHPRKGELFFWIDCEETRQRAASLTSIECVPAESCREVTITGGKGTFFPLAESFSVKVVGDIEGARVEKTQKVMVETPETGARFTPTQAFADTGLSLCRWADAPAVTFAVTLDGVPIEATPADSTRPECLIVRPSAAGTLRAVPRLVDPEVELPAITATVHPLSDAHDVELRDQRCPGQGEIGAYEDAYGSWLVSVSATALLPGAKEWETPTLLLPASRIRIVLGEGEIVEPHGKTLDVAAFMLGAAPPPGSRVEIDLDGRIVAAPLRAKPCD